MLSGIETHKEKVLRIILAGQPELKLTLESPKLKQLLQRVRLRFHVGPLDRTELREYIEHRLDIAGHSEHDLFSDDTFAVIHQFSGGVPRLINDASRIVTDKLRVMPANEFALDVDLVIRRAPGYNPAGLKNMFGD